jgi:mitogen-activated protein kinase kinase kinase
MFHIGVATKHPPLPDPGQLSSQGIDFIRRCLIIDGVTRPTAVDLQAHPWIMDIKDALAEEDYISGTQSPAEDYGIIHQRATMLENQEADDLRPDDFSPQPDFSEQATPTVEFPVAIRA